MIIIFIVLSPALFLIDARQHYVKMRNVLATPRVYVSIIFVREEK